jgi:ERCC4-type nuclease
MAFSLQVDQRERGLFPVLAATFDPGQYNIQTLARGDFAITSTEPETPDAPDGGDAEVANDAADPPERLHALIERKTLRDLAASLKDQRLENLDGLLEVREQCGCDVWLLIEGPAFPAGNTKYGRVSYSVLEALILDASIRDGIYVCRSKDDAGTARLLQSLMGRYARCQELERAGIMGGAAGNHRAAHARALVMVRKERKKTTDASLVADMWAKLAGVSPAAGRLLLAEASVAEWVGFAQAGVHGERLDAIRYPSGQRLSAKARTQLRRLLEGDGGNTTAFYGGAPKMSVRTARLITAEFPLTRLCEGDEPSPALSRELSAFKPAGETRKFGKKGERLLALLYYSVTEVALDGGEVPEIEGAPGEQ